MWLNRSATLIPLYTYLVGRYRPTKEIDDGQPLAVVADARLPRLPGGGAAKAWRRRRVGGPEQAEVRAAGGIVRPGGVAHKDDLVARVGEQRQKALPLVVEAMRRPADLRRPEKPELARRARA